MKLCNVSKKCVSRTDFVFFFRLTQNIYNFSAIVYLILVCNYISSIINRLIIVVNVKVVEEIIVKGGGEKCKIVHILGENSSRTFSISGGKKFKSPQGRNSTPIQPPRGRNS